MTRQLAQDALRYVTREYKDEWVQYQKMMRRHGSVLWYPAVRAAHNIHLTHGDRECMAVLQDMVERAISGKG